VPKIRPNGERLQPLPYPVYFVNPNKERWADVFDATDLPDPDDIHSRFGDSNDIWIVKTYLRLRSRGLDVRLVAQLVPRAINVIMNYNVLIRGLSYHCYVVCCRADTYRTAICHHTIVQNPNNVLTANDHLIQHWPQPGLIPRDTSRGSRLETIVYMGNRLNLCPAFLAPTFEHPLRDIGITFRVNEDPANFHDYRNSDVVLAVRDLTESDYFAKPASKLVNSWHAGVPALLGPEPAYQALRKTPLDYIEIRSPEEAIQQIIRLKKDPELFRQMAENGLTRARQFTIDQIAAQWRDVLAGPVAEGFSVWTERPVLWKSLIRPALFGVQAVRHIHEKRKYLIQRDHGFRPISGRFT
jgi:Glycosyl transferases group 1